MTDLIKESTLQEEVIVKNFETFMMCLYWVSHDHKIAAFQPWRSRNSGTQEDVFRYTAEEVGMINYLLSFYFL